jgi:hypothetical protein
MSNELERELERVLQRPQPGRDVTERARRAALDVLPEPPGRLGHRHRLALAAALACTALAVTGVTLAASGTVRRVVGIDRAPAPSPELKAPAPPRLLLPAGSQGIAVATRRRTWIAVPGRSLSTTRFSAVELTPSVLYVAAGVNGSVEAIASATGRSLTLRKTEGQVVQIAWAPNPIEVAYVVRSGGRYRVHLMEGTGRNDRMLDRSASAVRPSWRADSMAFAYVGADGRPVVRDLVHDRARALELSARCRSGRALAVAFAPVGNVLAVALTGGRVAVVGPAAGRVECVGPTSTANALPASAGPVGLAWISRHDLVVAAGSRIERLVLGRAGSVRRVADATAPGRLEAIAVRPGRGGIVAAVGGERLRIVQVRAPSRPGQALRPLRTLLDVPGGPGSVVILWR